ncbi:hypothetical protein DL765_004091 [Monosporascus sp. GIB2]|nr:hypothetical protein DL765_004091 [Monosporascus sp. GIB2]
MQGGVCSSMLAAIALEKSAVPLASVSSVSMMRANGDRSLVPTITGFARPLLRKAPRIDQLVLPSVMVAIIVTGLSQLISTALLSDISLQQIFEI